MSPGSRPPKLSLAACHPLTTDAWERTFLPLYMPRKPTTASFLAALLVLSACSAHRPKGQVITLASARTFEFSTKSTSDGLEVLLFATPIASRLGKGDNVITGERYAELRQFSGQQGEQITADMRSDELDGLLMLVRFDADGMETIAIDDDGGDGFNARLQHVLSASGEYALVATSASGGQSGAYTLIATRGVPTIDPTDDQPPMLSRVTATQSIFAGANPRLNDGTPYRIWRVEGGRGERLLLTFTGVLADALIAVPVADGLTPLPSTSVDVDEGRALEFDLPATGTYAVIVSGDVGVRYSISVRSIPVVEAVAPPATLVSSVASPADPRDRYALLVGIDDYPGRSNDLPSSLADVDLMRRTLVESYGFSPENIVVLRDGQATRSNLIAAFDGHLGQAGKDGVALFYFSGHGMQLDTNQGLIGADDDEADGRDEALVLWGRSNDASILFDDELGSLLAGVKSDRTLVILDACHTGTGTRGGETKSVTKRQLDDLLTMPEPYERLASSPPPDPDDAGDTIDLRRSDARHLLLAATMPDELALARREPWPDGQVASAYTYYLAAALAAASDGETFEQMSRRVSRLTGRYASVIGGSQTPQLEGSGRSATVRAYLAPAR